MLTDVSGLRSHRCTIIASIPPRPLLVGETRWRVSALDKGHKRQPASRATRTSSGRPRPSPGQALDGLRSLPQLAGRDRRAIAQAAPAPSQHTAPHGSAVPSWGHRSYPVTEFNQSTPQRCRFTARPWLRAPRSRLARGKAQGAKRPRSKASIMAAARSRQIDHSHPEPTSVSGASLIRL